jgi:thiamine pyrophosphokinase
MKACILFLHGRYDKRHQEKFAEAAKERFAVAVDGGLRFFKLAGLKPDLVVGDMDSVTANLRPLLRSARQLVFPVDKDKTDTQLALEVCLKAEAQRIDIVQPSYGQPDHFLGNVLLLSLVKDYRKRGYAPRVAIVDLKSQIEVLADETRIVYDAVGETVSIVPLSSEVIYSCRGVKYGTKRLQLRRGENISLRNRITARRARFEIKGEVLLVRNFTK